MIDLLLNIVVDGVVFAVGMRMGWRMHRDQQNAARPYQWSCPEKTCIFHFESSDASLTLQAADNHEKSHIHD